MAAKRPGRPKGSGTTEMRLKGFGPRLREIREKRGMSQHELARALGAHWTQVSRYERDLQLPTADRVVGLAQVLHTSLDALLLGEREPEDQLELKNVRLYERFRELDQLPKEEQETVLRLVDAVLAKHKLEHLADQVRSKAR